MAKKSYIIIGVGNFALSIIKTISHTDIELLVIDNDPKKLDVAAEYVTNTVCADARDADVLRGLDVAKFDGAIVAIGTCLEAKVLIVMQLKEMGVPFVMAKGMNELENRILTKIGADKIISPEKEMGIHVGNQIARGNLFSSIELTENYSITDFVLPSVWEGKTIKEINVRSKYGVNIIGIRRDGNLMINPDPDKPLQDGEVLVILGENSKLQTLRDKHKA